MNILIASMSAPSTKVINGGAQVYILEIAREFVREGHRVTIVAGREYRMGVKLPGEESIDQVQIRRLPRTGVRLIQEIHQYVRQEQDDVDVVLENMMSLPLYLPLVRAVRSKLFYLKHHFLGKAVPGMLAPHKALFNLSNEYVWIPLLYSANRMIVPSKRTKAFLQRRATRFDQAHVIDPGIEHVPRQVPRDPDPTILYVGTLQTNRKKVDHLIKAFADVVRKVPRAKLIIAGDGPHRQELVEMAEGLPAEFCGWVSEEEKHKLYDRAWVFASPSLIEGFGITWVEANSHGLPLVGYNIGLETVNKQCAMLCTVGDVSALAHNMVTLLTDEKIRRKMSARAVENAARFSWKITTQQFLSLFEVPERVKFQSIEQ